MSLLEDVFLEDEAGEAHELERVIEGDEYDERPLSPNSDDNEEKDDEAEEDKRRVDPTQTKTKRVVKNPRFILNPARLTGPRGIQVIPDHFKDFKFKGKGYEKDDLDMVLKKLEHWAYRLYPKFGFHDCLKKIETLGKKRPVMVHLQKIRSDQFMSEEAIVQKDSSDEEDTTPAQEDEFDKLLQQQIDLARATPAPGSVKKAGFNTPAIDRSLMMPKATSSPSISDEQRERMLRNKQLAEERRLAKLRNDNSIAETPKKVGPETTQSEVVAVSRKLNRSQVISSDEDEPTVNKSIAVNVDDFAIDNIQPSAKETVNKHTSVEATHEPDFDNEIKPIPRRINKPNIIDSSDDELSEPIQIDVEINENNAVFKENPEFIGPTNINVKEVRPKHNISNAINSSDDENLVIDTEVHSKDDEINYSNIDRTTKDNLNSTTDIDASHSKTDKKIDNTVIEPILDDIEKSETNKLEIVNNSISDILKEGTNRTSMDTPEFVDSIKSNTLSSDVLNTGNSELNDDKQNKENNVIDEVMDIDFSDDF